MKFDEFLFSHLGEMGKYQKIQFILVCLPCIFCAMHSLSWTFAAVPVAHRCAVGGESRYSPYWNSNISHLFNTTKDCFDENWNKVDASAPNAICQYETCQFADGLECSSWVYDTTRVQQSAVGRWDIVCDGRSWIKALVQSAYYIGQMGGSMTFGMLGDRIGRKKCFFIAIALQIACAFLQSIAPNWWLYTIFRVGTGFAHPGASVIAVVIGTELMGPKYRKLASIVTALCMAIGQVFLGATAIVLTDYQWLHIAITAPSVLFISYWWLIHESARWLVSTRRFKEADHILQKAARTNGVTLPDEWWTLLDGEEKSEKSGSGEKALEKVAHPKVGDLLRTPILRQRSLVVFYLWPVVSMVYYGLSMKSDILGGDLYVNFIISALMELPALLVVYFFLDSLGRRPIIIGGYALTGICLLTNLFIGDTAPRWIAILQLLISRGAISGTYAGIYAFTPELFPTTHRNSAMGVCSTVARVGAISASFMAMWIAQTYGRAWLTVPFGVMTILAALLTMIFLPETTGKPLPATIEEVID
ncbi:hypothetical protein PFISCL1PPCAC_16019, partial [Pristionchus fissidentatus]